MDDSKTENIYLRFIKFLISISLSIALLEFSGIDTEKMSVFSFDKFTLPILILGSICLYSFENMLQSIIEWFNKKSKRASSN
ncbi:MAG: hypothetical protein JKX90_07310 [Colwellia sp.]|nr:hypothetical protein [Colwellia sp.]